MRQGLPYSKLNTNYWLKMITFDLICFILVSIFAFGFCYAYFSDEVKVAGKTTTASLMVEYWQNVNSGSPSQMVYGILDGSSTAVALDDVARDEIVPGQSVTITGCAANTSNIPVYIMGKLEVEVTDKNGAIKLTETVWYNISTGQASDGDHLTIGASILDASTWTTNKDNTTTITTPNSAKQVLSLQYTFDGATLTNDDIITKFNFTLVAHQSNYLTLAEDYNQFISLTNNQVSYTQIQVYAAHCITGLELAS